MKYSERRKQQFRQGIYRIALISFVVVIFWIGFEVYWAYKKQSDVNVNTAVLEPVSPELYLELAQELLRRNSISQQELDEYLQSLPDRFTPVPVEPSPTPESTDSGIIP